MATVNAGIYNGCGLENLRKKEIRRTTTTVHGGGGDKKFRINCVASTAGIASDPYQTLKIRRGASESEVKKAFRQLALKYHPDVCKGNNCTTQFHQIYQAYDIVMGAMKGGGANAYVEEEEEESVGWGADQDWDLMEEWTGWEGAGTRDCSSYINHPYA